MADVKKGTPALISLTPYLLEPEARDELMAAIKEYAAPSDAEKTAALLQDIKWPIDGKALVANRIDIDSAKKASQQFVDSIEYITFPYLDANQAEIYEDELSIAYYFALQDIELALIDQNRVAFTDAKDSVMKIGAYLWKLRNRHAQDKLDETPLEQLLLEPDQAKDGDLPCRYLGYTLMAPLFAKMAQGMVLEDLKRYAAEPAKVNDGRLYLVWLSEMLTHMLTILSQSFHYISVAVAQCVLAGVNFVTGSLGWILYFMRGGIETALLLNNTVDMTGSVFEWVWPNALSITKDIKDLGLTFAERWRGQWHIRKQTILNDAAWGIINFICFFFLYGAGGFGYAGDVLNAVLFVFDLWLCYRIFAENQTDKEAEFDRYLDAINKLEAQIAKMQSDGADPDIMARAVLRLKQLKEAYKQVQRDWYYKQWQAWLDCIYAAAIVISFAILCSFFILNPAILPLTSLAFLMIGSTMCFSFGVVYESLSTHINWQEIGQQKMDLQVEIEDIFKAYQLELRQSHPDEHKLRMMFIEFAKPHLKITHCDQWANYYQLKLWSKLFIDLMVPVLFLACFVFMPLGLGIASFGLGLLLLFAVHTTVQRYQPAEGLDKLDAFPEKAFQSFNEDVKKGVCDLSVLSQHCTPEALKIPNSKPPSNELPHEMATIPSSSTSNSK